MNGILKKTLLVFMLFSAGYYYAQNAVSQSSIEQAPATMLFAQGILPLDDLQLIADLDATLKNHPNVKLVRLDHYSHRFFMLIQNLDALSEQDLRSWFGEYGDALSCIQIGVHGIDRVNSFPFTNCSN